MTPLPETGRYFSLDETGMKGWNSPFEAPAFQPDGGKTRRWLRDFDIFLACINGNPFTNTPSLSDRVTAAWQKANIYGTPSDGGEVEEKTETEEETHLGDSNLTYQVDTWASEWLPLAWTWVKDWGEKGILLHKVTLALQNHCSIHYPENLIRMALLWAGSVVGDSIEWWTLTNDTMLSTHLRDYYRARGLTRTFSQMNNLDPQKTRDCMWGDPLTPGTPKPCP